MKIFRKIAIISFVLGILLCIVSIYMGSIDYINSKLTNATEEVKLEEVYSVDSSEISNLEIDFDAVDLEFKTSNNDQIIIETNKDFNINTDSNTLTISSNSPESFFTINIPVLKDLLPFSLETNTMIIYLPEDYKFDTLTIENDAGSITGNDIYGETFIYKSDAGSINVNNVESDNVDLTIDVGSVVINSLTSDSLIAHVNVGDLQIDYCNSLDVSVSVDVGTVELVLPGNEEDYNIFTNSSLASINVDAQNNNSDKTLNLKCDVGEIEIDFIN